MSHGAVYRIEGWVRQSPLACARRWPKLSRPPFTGRQRPQYLTGNSNSPLPQPRFTINQDIQSLQLYVASLARWYGFIQVGIRRRGARCLINMGWGPVRWWMPGACKGFWTLRRSQLMLAISVPEACTIPRSFLPMRRRLSGSMRWFSACSCRLLKRGLASIRTSSWPLHDPALVENCGSAGPGAKRGRL